MKLHNKIIKISWCLITFSIVSLLLASCTKRLPPTSEITYHGNKNNVITLTSVGYGKNKKQAILDAEKNAFNVLFFRGIPDSPYTRPMIYEPEDEVKNKKEKFFEQFYDELGYRNFVVSSKVINPGVKDKMTKKMVASVKISINIISLRRDLEQKKVIHKFGL